MVDGINCSIDECLPCLEPDVPGRIHRAVPVLGHRPGGDPTLLPFQTLGVAHARSRT